MVDTSVDRIQSLRQSVPKSVHIGLRLVLVALVAKLYVGPDWKNFSVLFGALALLVLKIDLDAV